MLDLYTSMTRFKQAMNGGTLPPMTPIPENVRHIIDPAFTPGLGAFEEHPETTELRCPVPGCGRYFDKLGFHLNKLHRDIGGARAVKRALSIPQRARLSSRRLRDANRRALAARGGMSPKSKDALRVSIRKARTVLNASPRSVSMMIKDFRDRCDTQLAHKIIDLRNELGRTPLDREFSAKYGVGKLNAVRQLYGTWNNALSVELGIVRGKKNGTGLHECLEALHAWHCAHGELPSADQVNAPKRAPRIPSKATILRVFSTESWPEAMRQAAAILDIHGGRYGLPVKKESAA